MADQVFGIDLGTTYSAVSLVNENGEAKIIKNFDGQDTTPSVVYFEEDGTASIGSIAKNQAAVEPDNTSQLIKRHMGDEYPQEFRGKEYTPEGISALILKELVKNANEQNNLDINKVVITVPAYFGMQNREATKQAGEIAGLEVVSIIPEPVAAAISLTSGGGTSPADTSETVLVYDLGGGTFDTTIMQTSPGKVDVVNIDGNKRLGGADWDKALEGLIVEKFVEAAGLESSDEVIYDEDFMISVAEKVEDIKKKLSVRPSTSERLDFNGQKASVDISRTEFEEVTRGLVTETIAITKRTIEVAEEKVPGIKIDRLLMVGGSCRMPMIEQALQEAGFAPEKTDFDLSVAMGAALFGAGVEWAIDAEKDGNAGSQGAGDVPLVGPGAAPTVVSNVLSRGIGIEFARKADSGYENYISFLAHANDKIPLERKVQGGILSDGQTSIEVGLYEQLGEIEDEAVESNKAMKKGESTTITGLPPMKAGDPVDIKLIVNDEGTAILNVVEPKSGKSFTAEASVSVLSREQVEEQRNLIAQIDTSS